MSSTETETTEVETTEVEETKPEPKLVPLAEVQTERRRAGQYKSDLDKANARLKELEDRDKTDLERITGERDTLKAQAESATAQAAAAEKRAKLRIELYDAGVAKAAVEETIKLFDLDELSDDDSFATAIEAKKQVLPGLFGEARQEGVEQLTTADGEETGQVQAKTKDDDERMVRSMLGLGRR